MEQKDDCIFCDLERRLNETDGGDEFMLELVAFIKANDDATAAEVLAQIMHNLVMRNLQQAMAAGAAVASSRDMGYVN